MPVRRSSPCKSSMIATRPSCVMRSRKLHAVKFRHSAIALIIQKYVFPRPVSRMSIRDWLMGTFQRRVIIPQTLRGPICSIIT